MGRSVQRGQASVETVGLWGLVAALALTVGALVAREVVVSAPQPQAIAHVSDRLRPPGLTALQSNQPGIGPSLRGLPGAARDALEFKSELDREFAAGFGDRLRERGIEAIEDPESVLIELLDGPAAPSDAIDLGTELVLDIERIAGMEPGDASRASARDAGELAADVAVARALRALGRRVRGAPRGRRRGDEREAPRDRARAPVIDTRLPGPRLGPYLGPRELELVDELVRRLLRR